MFGRRRPGLPAGFDAVRLQMRIMREDGGHFAKLRDTRVLLYWPHGLGDFVHLAHVLPALEPSNRYWVARYGDASTALYEGARGVTPLYTGVESPANGFGSSARDFHLGVPYRRCDGGMHEILVVPRLAEALRANEIDTVLWSDYPEPAGRFAFPYHTKARALLRALTTERRRGELDIAAPLPHALDLAPSDGARLLLAERLHDVADREICVIATGGATEPAKNWPLVEAAEFARCIVSARPRTHVVVIGGEGDDRQRFGAEVSFADELFASSGSIRSIDLLKALLERARLFVGVPAGPFHLAMLRRGLPCVGLWQAHDPRLHDEPRDRVSHLLAKTARTAKLARTRAVDSVRGAFAPEIRRVETGVVRAADAWDAAIELLGRDA